MMHSYQAGWVHKEIASKLERFLQDAIDKKSPRLIIQMPPRSGKSQLTSVFFPAWALGKYPWLEIIAASYSASLAVNFSRQVRHTLRERRYRNMFHDTRLDDESQSADGWRTTKGGMYLPVGVGGPATGRGAHCVVLDEGVYTAEGRISAYELVKSLEEVEQPQFVLSYNGASFQWSPVDAACFRRVEEYYVCRIEGGRVLRATGEHPVCVGSERGRPVYCRMDELRVGSSVVVVAGEDAGDSTSDEVVREVPGVREGLHEEPEQVLGGRARLQGAGAYLLRCLREGVSFSAGYGRPYLRRVWRSVSSRQERSGEERSAWSPAVLLKRLLWRSSVKDVCRGGSPSVLSGDTYLYALRERIRAQKLSGELREDGSAVLFSRVLRGGVERPAVVPFQGAGGVEVVPDGVQAGSERSAFRGFGLRLLRGACERLTSFGWRQGEQQGRESSACVPELPCAAPPNPTYSRVTSIEKIASPTWVCDFQVRETHNFVVSGVSTSNCLLIDDPIKNAEEAESATTRESIKDWYRTTAYTRLAPGGGALVIQTRWHTDDLAGWLEAESDSGEGDKFEVIRYPAIAVEDELYREKGEPLHPERYGREDMLRIKRAVGPRAWSALYQQNPLNDEASYFSQDMFRLYTPPAPRKLGVYAAFDLAVGQREANDYTVGVVIGVDSSDTIYVLDMVRGRWNSLQIVDEIVKLHKRHKPNMIGLEKGQIQLAIGPYLQKRIADDKLWDLAIRDLPTGRRDKQSRARSIQGRMAQGRVKFPKDAPWLSDMMAEMMSFPVGKHDDIVDAIAHLGLWLNDMSTPMVHEQGRLPSWRDKLRGFLPATRKTPMSV